MGWKNFVTVFFGIYFVLFVTSYIIVTVFPIFAICVLIINAACQTGNVWNLVLSLLLYNGIWAIILSPFAVDYLKMKKDAEKLHKEIDKIDAL